MLTHCQQDTLRAGERIPPMPMNPQTIELRDESSGSAAHVLAGFGFNCYSYCPVVDGRSLEVLWADPRFASGAARPSGSGIPILFPFAGRLTGTTLTYGGRTYELGSDDGRGNAIHGFVLNRPWRVVEESPAHVVGEFQASLDAPELLDRWPADFRIAVSYRIEPDRLRCRMTVTNPGTQPLPFGLGAHPYFRLPLGGNVAETCRVTVPVEEYWELADMLPTGRRRAVEESRRLAGGRMFRDCEFDDVFCGLPPGDGKVEATIDDTQAHRRLTISYDRIFRECVVYTPPHREAICIEPYTCVPDAFRLADEGRDTGLRHLTPGDEFQAGFSLRVE